MRYRSTRGQAPDLDFEDVVLTGLAEDGGLYVPYDWPHLDFEKLRGKSYAEVAKSILTPFMDLPESYVEKILKKSYSTFQHPDLAPLKKLEENLYLLELFHGPTLAFKDFALQFLGTLFEHFMKKRRENLTLLGATSGDTGSAAIEGCRGKKHLKVFILHPHNRISEVQRRQMTTVQDDNIFNIAVKGTFDDCQALVKELLNDKDLRKKSRLSSVNSINWARILAQIVYYVWACLKLKGPVSFAVPTGNFGNIYAAYAAKQMGAPITTLIVGSNRNDILTRYFDSGLMTVKTVEPSLSPSMDIQVSSNFERLLFEMVGKDNGKVTEMMSTFKSTGRFDFPPPEDFKAFRLDDAGTLKVMREMYESAHELVDPHTAVGLYAARSAKLKTPVVAVATAHPAKFPDAVEKATGQHPVLPHVLAGLYEKDEKYTVLDNDLKAVKAYIKDKI